MAWYLSALGLILGYLAFCDMRNRELPDAGALTIGLLGFLFLALHHAPLEWFLVRFGFAALCIGVLLVLPENILGGGDAKLLAALGIAIGPVWTLVLFFAACVLLAFVSLARSLFGFKSQGLPLAPPMFLTFMGASVLWIR